MINAVEIDNKNLRNYIQEEYGDIDEYTINTKILYGVKPLLQKELAIISSLNYLT